MRAGYSRYKQMKVQAERYNQELDSVNVIATITNLKLQVEMLKQFQIGAPEAQNPPQIPEASSSSKRDNHVYDISEYSINEDLDCIDESFDPVKKHSSNTLRHDEMVTEQPKYPKGPY